MSMGSGSTALLATPQPSQFGIKTRRLASSEGGNPVPYIAGPIRLGFQWLEDVFNGVATPVSSGASMSGLTSGDAGLFSYTAAVIGRIGIGPVDRITAIYANQVLIWQGDYRRSDPGNTDSCTIVTSGNGTFKLYWGTETQPQDSFLLAAGPNRPNYPAYRGSCYFVSEDCAFGTSLDCPAYEFVVWRWPTPTWFTGGLTGEVEGDANPVAIAADWLQNPRIGLGLADSRLDTAGMMVAAQTLADECVGFAPVITQADTLRKMLVTLLQLCEGYLRRLPNGKITIGLMRPVAQNAVIPVLTEDDFTDEVSPTPQSWGDTFGAVQIVFTNREADYLSDGMVVPDMANLLNTQTYNVQQFDGSWITRPNLAQVVGGAIARVAGLPQTMFAGTMKRASGAALYPGAAFRLSYGEFGMCNVICRCQELTLNDPTQSDYGITFRIDSSFLLQPFAQPPAIVAPVKVDNSPQPFVYARVFEIGYFSGTLGHTVAVLALAARPTTTTTALAAWLKSLGGVFSQVLQSGGRFPQRGHLLADYGLTPVIDGLVGISVQMDGIDTTLVTADLVGAFTSPMLVICDDEIMYGWGSTLTGMGQYRVFAVRNRLETILAAHANGAEVWFVSLSLGTMPPAILPHGSPVDEAWKLQPLALGASLDLSTVAVSNVTVQDLALRPPPAANLAGGAGAGPLTQYEMQFSMGDTINLQWAVTTEEGPDKWSDYTGNLPDTILEFFTTGGMLMATRLMTQLPYTVDTVMYGGNYTPNGVGNFVYPALLQVDDFGGYTSFVVRATLARNTNRSLQYAKLTCNKL